ncbi:hypothetical protein WR25_24540 isoform B [Diploscapter pachys]|nr:hypothetical protein WR25_24540 isoform B [Diploscapter pachys]
MRLMNDFYPFLSASLYYFVVLSLSEITRQLLLSRVKSSYWKAIILEFIGTAQICTCIFENAILIQYGVSIFFVGTAVLGFCFILLNRGANCTPLVPIEQLYFGEISMSRGLSILFAQLLAGYFSYRIAFSIWLYTYDYLPIHAEFVNTPQCSLKYQMNFVFVMLFETCGTFAIRFVTSRLPKESSKYLAPAFMSSLFSFAILFVGDSALDPLVGSTLFYGCTGLPTQYFILLYWICPTIGWLSAAQFDRTKTSSKKKKD